MTGLELDATKILVLMILGGFFALFALYLMLRPPAQGAARLELFGLKFEASSAGILVFLIGAAFLSLPLWVTERSGDLGPAMNPSGPVDAAPRAENQAVILPAAADSRETEPNDTVHEANQIPLDAIVRGRVDAGEQDWYVVDTSEFAGMQIEFSIRTTFEYGGAQFFDEFESQIGSLSFTFNGVRTGKFEIGSNKRFYLRVYGGNKLRTYDIFYEIQELEF